MYVSIVAVFVGLVQFLEDQYRYYKLRQEAREAADRFVELFEHNCINKNV